MKCGQCGEDHEVVFMHGACHPESPTWTSLHLDEVTPVAVVKCATCRRHIVTLDLADSGTLEVLRATRS